MPDVRFYLKEEIYRAVLKDAEKSELTVRQFLQKVVEEAYGNPNS